MYRTSFQIPSILSFHFKLQVTFSHITPGDCNVITADIVYHTHHLLPITVISEQHFTVNTTNDSNIKHENDFTKSS